MNPKKLMLVAATAAIAASYACVGNNGDSPVQVLGTFATNRACEIKTDVQQGTAFYDLSGARQIGSRGAEFADVFINVQLKSEFSPASTTANGQTLSDSSRNGVYVDQIQLSYRSTPNITFENEVSAMHAYIAPGGTLNALTDVLGTKAAQKLLDNVNAQSPAHEVIAIVKFRGYTAGSTGATFTTNDIEFPITVVDQGVVCQFGPAADGPCGALTGQGGTACNSADGGTL